MKAKQNKLNKNWVFIKIILINWFIFVWILMLFVGWTMLREFNRQTDELAICRHNIEEIDKQIESGRIILQLKR